MSPFWTSKDATIGARRKSAAADATRHRWWGTRTFGSRELYFRKPILTGHLTKHDQRKNTN